MGKQTVKLFWDSKYHIDPLVKSVHFFNEDINIEWGLRECNILIFKRGKTYHCEEIVLPDGKNVGELQNEG